MKTSRGSPTAAAVSKCAGCSRFSRQSRCTLPPAADGSRNRHDAVLLGAAAIPLGLILTGATIADQMRDLTVKHAAAINIGASRCGSGSCRWSCCCSRGLSPARSNSPGDPDSGSDACAMIPVLLAKHYGGDPAVAMRSPDHLADRAHHDPLWIQLGIKWVG